MCVCGGGEGGGGVSNIINIGSCSQLSESPRQIIVAATEERRESLKAQLMCPETSHERAVFICQTGLKAALNTPTVMC